MPIEVLSCRAIDSHHNETQGAQTIGPEQLALHVAALIADRQGTDVSILDVTGPLVIADYFVIATVRNDRHGVALARELMETLKAEGFQRRNVAGLEGDTGWVLLDFDEVVVHLFIEESRRFYDLENLWSDAPRRAFTPPFTTVGTTVGTPAGIPAVHHAAARRAASADQVAGQVGRSGSMGAG